MEELLVRLHVENLGLIDRLDLEFCPCLNVLTGETGTGKSMIVDAVDLVAGARASAETVRSGAQAAVVEALFDLAGEGEVSKLVDSLGLQADDSIVLTREVSSAGRSTCRVNGRLASVGMLRQIGSMLVDLHGQHESQSLLEPREQLRLLDHFAGLEAVQLRAEVAEARRQVAELNSQLKKVCGDEREVRRRVELLRYQINEVDGARLRPGEEEELFKEQRVLANAAKLQETVGKVRNLLFQGDGEPCVIDLIGVALRDLSEAMRIDEGLSNIHRSIEEIEVQLQDLARDVSAYADRIVSDPERLTAVERRIDLLNDLKRKYGENIEQILRFREEAARELETLMDRDVIAQRLLSQVKQKSEELSAKRDQLRKIREKAAASLSVAVAEELHNLGMPAARFETRVGEDSATFWFSANPGEPLMELSKVASGGELSRVMLAIETVSVPPDSAATLVFDEVDAGIAGVVAHKIAALLAKLAKRKQVICVTHLPQIAAIADSHYCIVKQAESNRNVIRIRHLDYEERLHELARMMGDGGASRITIEHAKEMMSKASQLKKSL